MDLILVKKCKELKKTGLKRNIIDKFYTNIKVVMICYEYINSNLKIDFDKDLIVEPSAGNGSFINIIKKMSNNYKFYDIYPENEDIIKEDYLKLDTNFKIDGKCHVIGNPPFGRQSSLAIKFIKKSCSFCDSISFILPKSFKKDSMKKYFPLNFHLIFEQDLPDNSFLNDGTNCDVPSIFQIWIKKDTNRKKINKIEPKGFKFVKKSENPHISFRRVGVYAGGIDIDIKNKSEQSHYFIIFDTFNKNLLDKISAIKFNFNNTVGPKSISKQELIKELNNIIL